MSFKIGKVNVGRSFPMVLVAGPCAIESEQRTLEVANFIYHASHTAGIEAIFKASFDKANRTKIDSFRGIGFKQGLEVLALVKKRYSLPILTDVHEPWQVEQVAEVADCLQVPAFLCRQTDLICECARSGKPVNVKKGQWMSPEEMTFVVNKLLKSGATAIMLTERGTFFGYNNLVNDMTAIPKMQRILEDMPVLFDVTHSCQLPGVGGMVEYRDTLAKAAVAAGANGLYIETHTETAAALCDSTTMLPTEQLGQFIQMCKRIENAR